MKVHVSVCLAALACGSVALAQEVDDPRPLVDRVDVNLVDVDVTVTDRDGNPVTGLGIDDFIVTEDGKPVEIKNFHAIESFRVRSQTLGEWEPIGAGSPFRRRVVLVVDNNTLEVPERNSALESLRGYLSERFDDNYEWAVIAVGEEVKVVQPLTNQKHLMHTAFDRIEAMRAFGINSRPDRDVLDDPTRAQFKALTREQQQPLDPTADLAGTLRFESRQNAMRNLQASRRTAEAMLRAFEAYGTLDGQKVMILVTGGIEMNPELGFLGSNFGGDSPAETGLGGTSRDGQLTDHYNELRRLVDAIGQRANASQFRIYTVKATGLSLQMPSLDASVRGASRIESPGSFVAPVEIDDSDSAQIQLAGVTGGLALARNDLFAAFEAVDRDASVFYSLGYYPQHSSDGRYHRIGVEVKRPGLIARAREGYVDLTEVDRLEMHLATPLTFEKSGGSLPVDVSVARNGSAGLVATARLPLKNISFLAEGDQSRGRVWAWLSVYDAEGEVVDVVRRHRDLSFPTAMSAQALAQDLSYGLSFELPKAGRYTIAVTLRDEISGQTGTAFAPFTL